MTAEWYERCRAEMKESNERLAEMDAIVRAIAGMEGYDLVYREGETEEFEGADHCRFCDAEIWRGKPHEDGCLYVRARALVAARDAAPT